MSSTRLDLPVLVTPDQIRRREFVTTRRGYDVEQVRDYLEQLAMQVEQLGALVRGARLEAGEAARTAPAPRPDPYEQLADRLSEVLRSADREAERIRREGKEEAERVLREARADADRIRLDAQSKAEEAREEAERALREARNRADRTIAGLSTRRDTLVEQLAEMRERLVGVARELEATIDRPDEEPGDAGPVTTGSPVESEAVDLAEPSAPLFEAPSTETVVDLADDAPGEAVVERLHEVWAAAPEDLRIPEIPLLELDWDDDQE